MSTGCSGPASSTRDRRPYRAITASTAPTLPRCPSLYGLSLNYGTGTTSGATSRPRGTSTPSTLLPTLRHSPGPRGRSRRCRRRPSHRASLRRGPLTSTAVLQRAAPLPASAAGRQHRSTPRRPRTRDAFSGRRARDRGISETGSYWTPRVKRLNQETPPRALPREATPTARRVRPCS